MKLLLFTLSLAMVIAGCSDEFKNQWRPSEFTSFEISYTDGWTKRFSFFVDSNKIYFSPQQPDTVYYGLLPGELFKLIDTCISNMHADTAIHSKLDSCMDCSMVAVKLVSNGKTTRVNQTGNVDKLLLRVIDSLNKFVDENKHQKIHSVMFLETQEFINPLPPPFKPKA